MTLTFHGDKNEFPNEVIPILSELLGFDVEAVANELQPKAFADALRWSRALRATIGKPGIGERDWYREAFGKLIWGLLPVCKEQGALGVVDAGIKFHTPYGAISLQQMYATVYIQGNAWGMEALLRDVAARLPDAKVAARHENFPSGLTLKRPASQLVRELEALRNNTSNEVLTIIVAEPISEFDPRDEWTDRFKFKQVHHLDGSWSGIGWYGGPKNDEKSSPSPRGKRGQRRYT